MKTFITFIIVTLGLVAPIQAADFSGPLPGQCRLVGPSQLMTIENGARLTDEVVRLMNEAVAVADNPDWKFTFATRPVFLWASEAKVACGKAYGYLRNGYRDEQYLGKCECFYQRMQYYMH
ncbi:MAG: hypothetical protein C0605_06680 [Hyphomicrobiales bacterium]|nr:MAG: hypothetical protein C0605_06680 [Hyphomicrobiales bacterium]